MQVAPLRVSLCLLVSLLTACSCSASASCNTPAQWIDDDYCDCADSSDEPHTSACAGNFDPQFKCTDAVPPMSPTHIPVGHVNDGICDCCDGSDEAAAVCNSNCEDNRATVRQRMQQSQTNLTRWLMAKQKMLESTSACMQGLISETQKIQSLMKELVASLEEYQEDGDQMGFYKAYQQLNRLQVLHQANQRLLQPPHANVFGADLELCVLRELCFSVISNERYFRGGCAEPEAHDFNFTVCPYRFASQTRVMDAATPGAEAPSSVLLGRWLAWVGPRVPEPPDSTENRADTRPNPTDDNPLATYGVTAATAETSQTMLFAEGENCWGGPPRTVRVVLRCGDRGLITPREDGKCTYTFELETPVACTRAMLQSTFVDDEDDF